MHQSKEAIMNLEQYYQFVAQTFIEVAQEHSHHLVVAKVKPQNHAQNSSSFFTLCPASNFMPFQGYETLKQDIFMAFIQDAQNNQHYPDKYYPFCQGEVSSYYYAQALLLRSYQDAELFDYFIDHHHFLFGRCSFAVYENVFPLLSLEQKCVILQKELLNYDYLFLEAFFNAMSELSQGKEKILAFFEHIENNNIVCRTNLEIRDYILRYYPKEMKDFSSLSYIHQYLQHQGVSPFTVLETNAVIYRTQFSIDYSIAANVYSIASAERYEYENLLEDLFKVCVQTRHFGIDAYDIKSLENFEKPQPITLYSHQPIEVAQLQAFIDSFYHFVGSLPYEELVMNIDDKSDNYYEIIHSWLMQYNLSEKLDEGHKVRKAKI